MIKVGRKTDAYGSIPIETRIVWHVNMSAMCAQVHHQESYVVASQEKWKTWWLMMIGKHTQMLGHAAAGVRRQETKLGFQTLSAQPAQRQQIYHCTQSFSRLFKLLKYEW